MKEDIIYLIKVKKKSQNNYKIQSTYILTSNPRILQPFLFCTTNDFTNREFTTKSLS